MEQVMFDLDGPMRKVRNYMNDNDVNEFCVFDNSLLDAIQAIIEKWFTNQDERLFVGGTIKDQKHFDNLVVKLAYARINNADKIHKGKIDCDLSEKIETVEIALHRKQGRIKVLNEVYAKKHGGFNTIELDIIELLLDGMKKQDIAKKIGVSRQYLHRVIKTIIDKLKRVNRNHADQLTTDYRNDPMFYHSIDLEDLRYRVVQ